MRTRPTSNNQIWYDPLKQLCEAAKIGMGCEKCGKQCCTIAPIMTYNEAMIIEDFLRDNPIGFEPLKYMCQFLNPDGTCFIYEVRPLICRMWGPRNGECKKMTDGFTDAEIRAQLLALLTV